MIAPAVRIVAAIGLRTLARAGLVGLCCLSTQVARAAEDFEGLPRFATATLEDAGESELAPRVFVLGAVERQKREVRMTDFRRFSARVETRTYELPRNSSLDELDAYYRRLLDGRLVFACRGRDCGLSTVWANTIFERALLYGPDDQQRYLAADLGDALVAIYLIERGNQRVYAHVVRYWPEPPLRLLPAKNALRDLTLFGHLRLEGEVPDDAGNFSAAELEALARLGADLAALPIPALFVVCHIYPSTAAPAPEARRARGAPITDRTEAALAQVAVAERCASTAAEAMTRSDGPRLLPFGVGPLAPDGPRPSSHVELVLPGID